MMEDWKETSIVYMRCSICNELYYIFDRKHILACEEKRTVEK